ncbi:MAG: Alpha-pyrone synthesis polyketide synthase-like Pks18 [Planctomycetota bacterium]|nr:Alpha-pyrone synthesis polyketide synthase-like Pks18 [Planctomycetota bacterium]
MSFSIWGMGTAIPETFIMQDRAAELASEVSNHSEDEARRLAILYRRTRIRKRHVVLLDRSGLPPSAHGPRGPTTRWRLREYDEQIRPLARNAASEAIVASGISPEEITHLLTVSCTGFAAPGFDLGLIRELGLSPTVERTHIGFMGCHGALNGLRVARAFSEANRSARILMCIAELCSLHFQYGCDSQIAVSNALFADGAAALIGAFEGGGSSCYYRVAASGSFLVPNSEDAMTWQIGDHGFEMTLSSRVSGLICEYLRPWLEAWLAKSRLTIAHIGSWAIHPGGPRILDAVEEALGLDRAATEESHAVLESFGNMSSPTIVFILDRLRRRNAPLPCVALAFGPGLAVEATLFG